MLVWFGFHFCLSLGWVFVSSLLVCWSRGVGVWAASFKLFVVQDCGVLEAFFGGVADSPF